MLILLFIGRDRECSISLPDHHSQRRLQHYIDTPLSYDALTAPDLTYTLVRPLEEKYNDLQQKGNKSVVFCFLLNRVHFLRQVACPCIVSFSQSVNRDQNLASAPLSRSRAELCEILAIRTLRAHVRPGAPVLKACNNDVISRVLAIIFSRYGLMQAKFTLLITLSSAQLH
jgi:hypothetical protein